MVAKSRVLVRDIVEGLMHLPPEQEIPHKVEIENGIPKTYVVLEVL